jgi:hypothetical protein
MGVGGQRHAPAGNVYCKRIMSVVNELLLNVIFQLNPKTAHFRTKTYVYMNPSPCFDMKNSPLKSVQAFQTRPVEHRWNDTDRRKPKY